MRRNTVVFLSSLCSLTVIGLCLAWFLLQPPPLATGLIRTETVFYFLAHRRLSPTRRPVDAVEVRAAQSSIGKI
jgi:hypothetical protein